MGSVIRATTPTIKYVFKHVSVSDIVKAYVTIAKNGVTVIEKDISEAVRGENSLSWTLSQAETLSLAAGYVKVELNWLTQDGTRGASRKVDIVIDPNLKEEII